MSDILKAKTKLCPGGELQLCTDDERGERNSFSTASGGHYSEVSLPVEQLSSSSQLLQYWVKSTLHRAGEFRTTILHRSFFSSSQKKLLGNASICMRQLKHFWRKISPPLLLLLLPSAFTSISAPMILPGASVVALPEVARKQN